MQFSEVSYQGRMTSTHLTLHQVCVCLPGCQLEVQLFFCFVCQWIFFCLHNHINFDKKLMTTVLSSVAYSGLNYKENMNTFGFLGKQLLNAPKKIVFRHVKGSDLVPYKNFQSLAWFFYFFLPEDDPPSEPEPDSCVLPISGVKLCWVCGCPGSKACSRCHNVTYCGKHHQTLHWKHTHKKECCSQGGCSLLYN